MTFYETLDTFMKEKNMSAAELCEKAGIYESYVSRLKNGKIKDATWDKALAIFDALEISPSEFRNRQISDK